MKFRRAVISIIWINRFKNKKTNEKDPKLIQKLNEGLN